MLIANWRQVLKHAWSIRIIILAGLLSGVEVVLPIIDGFIDIPRGVFAGASMLATAGAFVARLVAQSKVPPAGAD